jgi:hypothetical protein
MKRLRGGLVFQAHRLVYLSTLGWREMKKKKKLVGAQELVVCQSEENSQHVFFFFITLEPGVE